MLFTFCPVAMILDSICHVQFTVSSSLPLEKLASVLTAVSKKVVPIAMHLRLTELANIKAPTVPFENTQAFLFVISPFAIISRSVHPSVHTSAVFFPLIVLSFKLSLTGPHLYSMTMLSVVHPFSLIDATSSVLVCSLAVSRITSPVPRVLASIFLFVDAVAISSIVAPVAFEARPTRPSHYTSAVSHTAKPLAVIIGTRFIFVTTCDYFCIPVEWCKLGQSFMRLVKVLQRCPGQASYLLHFLETVSLDSPD